MKLNIGAGKEKIPGFKNLDIAKGENIDIVADLNKGIPVPDNSVDEVYGRYILNHIKDFEKVMSEIYRVCKDNAKLTFINDYCHHFKAYSAKHYLFIHLESFSGYLGEVNYYDQYPTKLKNQKVEYIMPKFNGHPIINLFYTLMGNIANKNPYFYENFFGNIFPAENIKFILYVDKKRK